MTSSTLSVLIRCIDAHNGAIHCIEIPKSKDTLNKKLRRIFQVHPDAKLQLIDSSTGVIVTPEDIVQQKLARTLHVKLYGNDEMSPLRQYDAELVTFREKLYGMTIKENGNNIVVKEFVDKPDGTIGTAEASRQIHLGDAIRKVDGTLVTGCKYNSVVEYLKSTKRPIEIEFYVPKLRSMNNLIPVEFTMPNLDLTITYNDSYIFVKKADLLGYASSHGVQVGDRIHAIQGQIISGNDYEETKNLLEDPERPLVVIFYRPTIVSPQNSQVEDITSSIVDSRDLSPLSSTETSTNESKETQWKTQELINYCMKLHSNLQINSTENENLLNYIASGNTNIIRAIKSNKIDLVIALARSSFYQSTYSKLLKSHETLILTGKVRMENKDYDLLLISRPSLILINSKGTKTNIGFLEILGYQEFSNSSFSIDTRKKKYLLSTSKLSAQSWIFALKQYTSLQGYLKVENRNRYLFDKKRYFVLDGKKLRYYKTKEDAVKDEIHRNETTKLLFLLDQFQVEIVNEKEFAFRIICIQSHDKLSTVLRAETLIEFHHWISALQLLQKENLKS